MNDFEKLINASDLIEWIMETYPDWCVGDVRGIVDHIDNIPSAQPKTKCIAEIKISKEDMEELISEKIEEIKAAQPEIVRCRDCVYGEQDDDGVWFCRSLGCQIGDIYGNGFCADAERRTDEE